MTLAIERLKSNRLHAGGKVGGIRTELLEMAAKLDDVITMGRGDPDFDTPRHIVDAAKKALDQGATHYTPIRGTMELRRAIAEKLKRENNLQYDPDNEIIVTVGAEEAVFLTFYALLSPGDEVIVPTPRYTSYDEAIKMWGGEIAVVPCEEEDEFTYDPEVLRQHITPRTKIISLVNPGNPLGMLDPDKVRAIADIALEHDLLVVSDEIYEKFIYDGTPHLSMASLPGMKERCVTINGPSKAYAMTGWRCGFLAAPAPICEMLTEPAHTVAICCPAVTQAAALAAYTGPQDCVQQMKDEYDKRRRIMVAWAEEMGFSYVPPRAGFYVYIDVSSLGLPADDFCRRLLREERVMAFPGTLFGDTTKRFIRVGVLTPTERIALGAQRMTEFVTKVRRGA